MLEGLDLFFFLILGWFIANILISMSLEFGISLLTNIFGSSKTLGNFLFGIRCLGFFGVVIHELGHQLMCKVWKLEIVHVKLLEWNDGFQGEVAIKKHGNPVAQIFVTLGPIITVTLCTAILWIYYQFLGSSTVEGGLKFMVILLLFSLILGLLPSRQDWKTLLLISSRNPTATILAFTVIGSSITAFFFLVPFLNYFLTTIICFFTCIGILLLISQKFPAKRQAVSRFNATFNYREKQDIDGDLKNFLDSENKSLIDGLDDDDQGEYDIVM